LVLYVTWVTAPPGVGTSPEAGGRGRRVGRRVVESGVGGGVVVPLGIRATGGVVLVVRLTVVS